jgi:hypothetical protein
MTFNLSNLIPSGTRNNITLLNLLLAFIPYGTLYIRMTKLNYSIDKIYLEFLTMITPLSFIPMAAMYFGFVKPGEGKTPPYDIYMIFPMIAQILLSLFIDKILILFDKIPILSFLSQILSKYPMLKNLFLPFFVVSCIITWCNYIRRKKNCKDNENDKKMKYADYLSKAALDAVSENVSSLLLSIILIYILKFTPLKIFYTPISKLVEASNIILGKDINIDNIIQALFWNVGFGASYIILNMINQDKLNVFCNYGLSNFGVSTFSQIQIILTIVGIALTVGLKSVNTFIP